MKPATRLALWAVNKGAFDVPDGSWILRLLAGIFSLIGLGLVVASVVLVVQTRSFLQRAATATGDVVALQRQTDTDNRTLYRPVVTFVTAKGALVQFESGSATNPPAHAIGDKVEVVYDPANPQSASIRAFFDLWGVALILGGIGVAFSLVGLGLLVVRIRERMARSRQQQARVERESLADFGRKVVATIREVRAEPDDTYRIIAQWLDPGVRSVYVFESDPLGYDPAANLGETIPVFVDPNDPALYLVDLSGLPTLGNPD